MGAGHVHVIDGVSERRIQSEFGSNPCSKGHVHVIEGVTKEFLSEQRAPPGGYTRYDADMTACTTLLYEKKENARIFVFSVHHTSSGGVK